MAALLEITDVKRAFGGHKAVDGVSLSLNEGEITCLLGPSGCGKSTLLRLISGLETIDGGTIAANGVVLSGKGTHVPPEKRDMGFVFQDYALFPHLSVRDNIGFGLKHLSALERDERIASLLATVRLSDKAKLYPSSLSGGEQQRIALARALARHPRLILLDEPFSGLDAHLKSEVREATLNILETTGTTAIMVTHDAEEALSMGHSLALMNEGKIIQTGTPEECYFNPASLVAARLLGETNLVPAKHMGDHITSGFGSIPAKGPAAIKLTLCIRPEAFVVEDNPSDLTSEVEVTAYRYHGAYCDLVLKAPNGDEAHAHVSSLRPYTVGQTVHVRLEPKLVAVFA
ncbi:ABC transporter ATP-binding protein [Asticcacaulis machinosus]|uniref:ABC transporter ATP-binding protein n=1 Tax=Asticcacaulis machinosus TaxID=2984211 RepID=A0ABT5HEW0_9CAUL|nr:ABC transporter ATP-binding protein [Asticcacaulis machinosus]MDC7674528.1 ABC transporter ATP-binding protein [Asticcacaulis machinosus]